MPASSSAHQCTFLGASSCAYTSPLHSLELSLSVTRLVTHSTRLGLELELELELELLETNLSPVAPRPDVSAV